MAKVTFGAGPRGGAQAVLTKPTLVPEGQHTGRVVEATNGRGGKGDYIRLSCLADGQTRVTYKYLTLAPNALFDIVDYLVSKGADRDEIEAMIKRGEPLELDTRDFVGDRIVFNVFHEEFPRNSGRWHDKVSFCAVIADEAEDDGEEQRLAEEQGLSPEDELAAEMERELALADKEARKTAA